MNIFRKLAAALLLASFDQLPASAQNIADPSFESLRGYNYFVGPVSIGSWYVDSGAIGVVDNGFGLAHSGNQVLVASLISTPSTSVVAQVVHGFIPGNTYYLSFYTSMYRNDPFLGEVMANVAIGSANLDFMYPADPQHSAFGFESPWIQRDLEFTAQDTSLRLQISTMHQGMAGFVGYDDFAIQPVPEPHSWVLGLIGALLLVGFTFRSRFVWSKCPTVE